MKLKFAFCQQVLLLIALSATQQSLAQEQLTLFLVRHAEKVDQSQESALTELGELRARAIAEILESEPVNHIYSTPFNRTMLTAKPAADFHQLTVTEYDGNTLQEFAEQLRQLEGVALIVGHSNTTPILVNHLVGTDFLSLDESIYDRVYVVTIDSEGIARLEMRFTEPRTP